MSSVAILGLGAMGSRLASNLLEAGHELYIWSRNRERYASLVDHDARPCVSPREAAQQAEIVISMLTDDEASQSVWLNEKDGAIFGLRADAVAIESSTISLDWCDQLALQMQKRNKQFLDAPVVGSLPQAENRQLIYLVGGDTTVLVKAREVLNTNANAIHHVGKTCSAMAMKLAINAFFGIQVTALAELLSFINHCGINNRFAVDLLCKLPVMSPVAKGVGSAIVSGSYTPQFPINLVHKDFSYAKTSAHSKNANLPVTSLVCDLFAVAINNGYGKENIHAINKIFGSP